jgi:hypothetical protein
MASTRDNLDRIRADMDKYHAASVRIDHHIDQHEQLRDKNHRLQLNEEERLRFDLARDFSQQICLQKRPGKRSNASETQRSGATSSTHQLPSPIQQLHRLPAPIVRCLTACQLRHPTEGFDGSWRTGRGLHFFFSLTWPRSLFPGILDPIESNVQTGEPAARGEPPMIHRAWTRARTAAA